MKSLLTCVLALAMLAIPQMANAKSKVKRVTLTKDNSITLSAVVRAASAGNLVQQVLELDARLKSKDPIFLILDTPGGSIHAGLEMIENLRNVNRPIHTIVMNAYSMGFETTQGLGKRLITRDGTLMSHKGWGGIYGEFPGQMDNRYAWVLKRSERMAKRAVNRTKGKHTLKSYYALIENEFWCDGKDCLKQGFADYIVKPRCDKSLNGVHIETYDRWLEEHGGRLFLIEIKVRKSNCPVNTGILAHDIFINGMAIYGTLDEPSVLKQSIVSDKEDEYGEHLEYERKQWSAKLSPMQLLKIKNKAEKQLNATKERKAIVLP